MGERSKALARAQRRVCWRSPRRRLLLSAIECSIRSTPSSVAQRLPPVGQSARGRSRRPVQSKYLLASSEVESTLDARDERGLAWTTNVLLKSGALAG